MNKIKYIILLFILLLLIIPTIVAVDDSIKADSTIIVNASNITVGDIEKITVLVNEDATGVINITVDGKNYSAPIDKGIATFKIDNLASGSYDVSASYDGDENYLPGTNTSSFNVEKPGASASVPVKANEKTKANSTIIVNANNIAMGDSEKITVRVNEDATGSVTITVDGKTYSAPIDKGLTTFKIDNLASGSYDVLASYDGDENYLPGTNTSSFNVEKPGASASVPVKANEKTKANSTIIVNANNIAMGDSEKITVRVNEDATGSVTITVDGKTYSAPIDKGLTTFKIDNLASGSYDVLASYDGDENYLPGTNTSSFSVGKHNAPISVSAKDVKEGENAVVHVILPAGATGSVKVTVYDKSYTNQLIDGKTTVTVPDLAKGSYIVNVNYSGDDNYLANSTQVPLSVGKKAVEPPAIENNTDENLNDIGIDASTGLPIAILAIALIIIVAVVIVKRK